MAEGKPKSPKSLTKQLSDSEFSEDKQVNPNHKTSEEERHYRTIRGSALATQIAPSHSRAQENSTVERGPNCKVRIKKLPKDKAEDKTTKLQRRKNKQSDL